MIDTDGSCKETVVYRMKSEKMLKFLEDLHHRLWQKWLFIQGYRNHICNKKCYSGCDAVEQREILVEQTHHKDNYKTGIFECPYLLEDKNGNSQD